MVWIPACVFLFTVLTAVAGVICILASLDFGGKWLYLRPLGVLLFAWLFTLIAYLFMSEDVSQKLRNLYYMYLGLIYVASVVDTFAIWIYRRRTATSSSFKLRAA